VAGRHIKSAQPTREPRVFAAVVRHGVNASRPFKPATLTLRQEPRVAYGNGFAAAFLLVVTLRAVLRPAGGTGAKSGATALASMGHSCFSVLRSGMTPEFQNMSASR
jgi:hypothetical protein